MRHAHTSKGRRLRRSPLAAVLVVLALVLGMFGASPRQALAAEPTVDNPVLFTVRGSMVSGAVEYRIVVTGVFDQTYQSFTVTYPEELKLNYPGTITSAWNVSESQGTGTKTHTFIIKTGSATATELSTHLENMHFTLANPPDVFPPESSVVSIQASSSKVTAFVDPEGYVHYYTFVPNSTITWLQAYNAAKASSMQDPRFPGDPTKRLQGYLATITSHDEQKKVYNDIATYCGWLGGTRLLKSDRTPILDDSSISETIGNYVGNNGTPPANYWYWADGPEAGKVFYIGATYNSTGTAGTENRYDGRTPVEGTDTVPPAGTAFNGYTYYTYWGNTEPNNYVSAGQPNINNFGEYALQFAYSGASHPPGYTPASQGDNYLPPAARWNDFPNVGSGTVLGYYIEYGGYPGDPKADELGGSEITTSSEVELVMPIVVQYRSTVIQDSTVDPVVYRQISAIGTDYDHILTYENHLPYTAVRYFDSALYTITGYTAYGYTFIGSQDDRDNLTINGLGDVSGFHSTKNQRIVFQYKPNDYTVTFDANYLGWNSASVSPGSKTVQFDSPYGTLANAKRPGYTLTGWYHNQGDALLGTNAVSADDLVTKWWDSTLYAGWSENNDYVVHYDLNDSPSAPATPMAFFDKIGVSWTDTGLVPASNPTRLGYVFAGWSVTANGTKQGVTAGDTYGSLAASDAEDSITLQAQWKDASNIWVVYHLNGADSPASLADHQLDDEAELVPLPAASRLGYDFEGWLVADDGDGNLGGTYLDSDAMTFDMMAAPGASFIIVEAQWSAKSYAVNYDLNAPAGTAYGTAKTVGWLQNGLVPPLEGNPSRSGHVFMGWNTSPDGLGLTANVGSSYAQLAGGDDTVMATTLYALWQPARTYSVSYDTNGGSPARYDDLTGVYWESDNLLPWPSPPVGYNFAGWKVVFNGDKSGVLSSDTYGDLADDPNVGHIVLQAQWSPKQNFVVKYDLNGATQVGYPTQKPGAGSAPGEVVWTQINLLPAANPVRTGYTFLGWNTAEEGDGHPATTSDSYATLAGGDDTESSVTLYAQWVADSVYTVRYDLAGGSGSVPNVELLPKDIVPVLPEPVPPTGFDFSHWVVADDGYGNSSPAAVAGDKTYAELVWGTDTSNYRKYIVLKAIYTEKSSFTVNFNWNCGDAPTVDTITGVRWTANGFTPHSATQAGKNLLGWTTDQDGQSNYVLPATQYRTLAGNDDTVTEVTLYAQWEEASFIVRYDLNGILAPAGNNDYDQRTVGFDDAGLVPPSLDRVGYQLDHWVVSENGADAHHVTALDSYRTLAATGAPYITLQAQWVAKNYVVHYDTNGGSPAIASTPATGAGALRWWSTGLLPSVAPTRLGYTLQGWKLSNIGGTDLDAGDIAAGSLVTAATRYSDLAWDGTMDWGNITLQAQWLEDPDVTITYSPLSFSASQVAQGATDGGTVSPTSQSIGPASGTASSTATVKAGYSFVGWF
ncbi:MAG: InlB B-repeat-containing protein, partial [Micrococcales bacterium]|nr:InlB B-repeat-containing protein [Micrococcales bacterium]